MVAVPIGVETQTVAEAEVEAEVEAGAVFQEGTVEMHQSVVGSLVGLVEL